MNLKVIFGSLLLLILAGCSSRGEFAQAPPSQTAALQEVFVANFRSGLPPPSPRRSPPRPADIRFEKVTVSIPQSHTPGEIEWPRRRPDANRHFVTSRIDAFQSGPQFFAATADADTIGAGETLLFVHGYNTNHAEAVYLAAQLANDFGVPVPVVLFSWPSASKTVGYVYDRDSVLIARDRLEAVIIDLTKNGRRVVLLGHSMGSLLIMETLRQMEAKGSVDISAQIDALVLMAPDIDGDLFRDQVASIGLESLPQPFMIWVAEKDRALRISAFLTGRNARLGSETSAAYVADLPITLIDVSALASGEEFNHKIALSSPTVIEMVAAMTGDGSPGSVSLPERIVLTDGQPTDYLGGLVE